MNTGLKMCYFFGICSFFFFCKQFSVKMIFKNDNFLIRGIIVVSEQCDRMQ